MLFTELESQISALATASAALEPTPAELISWQEAADNLLREFIGSLSTQKTFSPSQPRTLTDFDQEVGDSDSPQHLLAAVKNGLTGSGISTAGAGHLGFIPGGGLYLGAVADHFAAGINAFTADAYSSPIGVYIHNQTVRWLADLIGYDDLAWGDVTSGGSQATLTALCVARDASGIKPRDYANTCVYLGEHTHHCSKKALDILFAGDLQIRYVPSINYVMDHAWLANQIETDMKNGLKPWLIVATAGSTNLGLVDPISLISTLARKYKIWLHVDGAYGGFFKLCPETSAMFSGLAEADSVVLDPHKGMFLPYGCGAVIFKDGSHLGRAFAATGSYLQDRVNKSVSQRSPMDYSMELTRPFRSLRVWLAIKVYGTSIFASALSEKLLLTRYACQKISALPNIVIAAPIDLSIFAFRYQPASGDLRSRDDCTKELLCRINIHREVFLTSTLIDGHFVIRVAVLSFRTHIQTMDSLVKIIGEESLSITMSLKS